MNKEFDISKIFSWFFTIVVIIVLIVTFRIYKKHYFGDFIKAENQLHISSFLRDKEVKYSKHDSYKIESPDYNDAVFYKEVKVKPNTPYKVTCMVKTKNVEAQEENTDAGAMICLLETTEVSNNIVGTNEWQELTFMFNSKDNDSVKIAFRLGGNLGNCKGTAWFSDFKLEEGFGNIQDSNWNMACFILKNVIVENNERISMDLDDIENIRENMKRFAESCKILSENKMNVTYDVYEIDEPITTLSYSEEYKYHVSPQDVEDVVSDIIAKEEYDHIICVIRMGDSNHGIEVNTGDWIGLRRYGFTRNRIFNNKVFYQ